MMGCSLASGVILQGIGARAKETADESRRAEPAPAQEPVTYALAGGGGK
jgi:hypothetical protein